MNMKKINIIVFFSIIIMFPVLTFFKHKQSFSENENRTLSNFPVFSLNKIFNKDFMSEFDDYFSDHFLFRENWISLNTNLEFLLRKKEINGIYILKDRFIEKIDNIEKSYIKSSLDSINNFYKEKNIPTSFMLIPTSQEIYKDTIPFRPYVINQNMIIDKSYQYLHSDISKIDTYAPINLSKDRYIYYRTDHHLSSLGSAILYSSIGKSLGFQPILLDEFNIEHSTYNFIGSLYSKVLYDKIEPDIIDIYHYNKGAKIESVNINTGNEVLKYESILFMDKLNTKNKYDVFLNGNYPFVEINTNNKNGKKLLLFKDSYANSMIQFLYHHYEKITLVDLRYINVSFENYIDINEYTQALFLYNVSNFVSENNIRKINIKK